MVNREELNLSNDIDVIPDLIGKVYTGSLHPNDDRWKHPVPRGECLVYTDGGGGAWCYVYIDSDRWVLESNYHYDVTANSMELMGILKGLQVAEANGKTSTFFSDSQYAVNSINAWMHKWKKNGWCRSKKGGEVKNLPIIKMIYDLKKETKANGIWVKGHDGHPINEMCDTVLTKVIQRETRVFIIAASYSDMINKLKEININL